MKLIKIAFRNLSRQKKRSFILGGAIAFGFLIVIMVDGLSAGILKSMENQMVRVLGGQIKIIGAQKDADKSEKDEPVMILKDTKHIEDVLATTNIQADRAVARTNAYGVLIFNGRKNEINLSGVDFEKESYLKNNIGLKSGSWDAILSDKRSILFSDSIADELNAQVGDIILFSTQTVHDKKTVGEFVLSGIMTTQGPLGQIYAYVHKENLNEIRENTNDGSNEYTLFFKNKKNIDTYADLIAAELEKTAPVVNRAEAKNEKPQDAGNEMLRQLKRGKWDGTKYAVVTINDMIPFLKSAYFVIQIVSLVFLIILFLVIMIGITNTFRIILYERITEIGTMRAFGWTRKNVQGIFLTEASILSILGASAGLIIAIIAMSIISIFGFDSNNTFAFFQTNAHWIWKLSPLGVFIKFLVIVLLTILAVRGIAKKAAHLSPAEALRTTK